MQNKESMHKELENVSIQDKYKINAKDKKHSKKNEWSKCKMQKMSTGN